MRHPYACGRRAADAAWQAGWEAGHRAGFRRGLLAAAALVAGLALAVAIIVASDSWVNGLGVVAAITVAAVKVYGELRHPAQLEPRPIPNLPVPARCCCQTG